MKTEADVRAIVREAVEAKLEEIRDSLHERFERELGPQFELQIQAMRSEQGLSELGACALSDAVFDAVWELIDDQMIEAVLPVAAGDDFAPVEVTTE